MILLLLGAKVLTVSPVHKLVSKVMTLSPTQKLSIALSSTDMNRLALTNGRIAQIFGADVFHIEMDEKNGQAFLRIKDEAREFLGAEKMAPCSLSFVTEDGMTQDLEAQFYEGVSSPCLFQQPSEKNLSPRRQVMNFFHDVVVGKGDDYVTQTTGLLVKREGLKIVFQKRILSPSFEASFYHVQSCGKRRRLHHQLFKEMDICGVYLSTTQIDPCHPATLVLVRRRL